MLAEQTNASGPASTSTTRFSDSRSFGGSASGTTGRSFTTESLPLPWTRRARTTTPALFELEVGGVEEEDLADLRLERVEPKRTDGRDLGAVRDRQLQLGTVGTFEQLEYLGDLSRRSAAGSSGSFVFVAMGTTVLSTERRYPRAWRSRLARRG